MSGRHASIGGAVATFAPVVSTISFYFAFHTLVITALPLTADDAGIASVAVTVYMGAGLLFDAAAASVATHRGLRSVVAVSAALMVVIAAAMLTLGDIGWALVPVALVLAACSSLIYIPGLAHYSHLLGARQARGQRLSVLVQRLGALAASVVVGLSLARGVPSALWWAVGGCGALLALGATRLPAGVVREAEPRVRLLAAAHAAWRETAGSRTMLWGLLPAMSMPLVFVLTGSVLPALDGTDAAAAGLGLIARELVALVCAALLARRGRLRANVEFMVAVVLCAGGALLALTATSPWQVVAGVALTGPVVSSAIIVSALNVHAAARHSTRPWACFGAMGMSARLSGLASPLLLGAAGVWGAPSIGAVFVMLLVGLGLGMWPGRQALRDERDSPRGGPTRPVDHAARLGHRSRSRLS
ncbi:hypothetical protein [Nocardioides sp. Root151]|uniref:hypothetical protein n=1 Tax=Nocardioides sp. Root151 TaxID=1736475 RepID=UPI000AC9A4C0|nr:hypothetical protein [Nocardioides sp. Root151]